jgi:hypothetical protein
MCSHLPHHVFYFRNYHYALQSLILSPAILEVGNTLEFVQVLDPNPWQRFHLIQSLQACAAGCIGIGTMENDNAPATMAKRIPSEF